MTYEEIDGYTLLITPYAIFMLFTECPYCKKDFRNTTYFILSNVYARTNGIFLSVFHPL